MAAVSVSLAAQFKIGALERVLKNGGSIVSDIFKNSKF